jgi:hypothetical protein
MIFHFPAWTGDAWGVAYHSPTLGAVVLIDGMTQERATSEAARLNGLALMREEMQRQDLMRTRRAVRYFEPDQYA